jgi:very-long-chain enoyl-CoA reductase
LEIDLATAAAEDLYDRIAKATGLNKNRLRITKGSDGSVVLTKRDDGKLVTVEETGLRDGSQIFVKDLGM